MNDLLKDIDAILKAADDDDMDTMYDYRASIMTTYAQAIAEFHFEEERLGWLNELIHTVEQNDIDGCRKVLAEVNDPETLFLGTQFVSIMAGCFHHDELITVVQAIGIKALIEQVQAEEKSTKQ